MDWGADILAAAQVATGLGGIAAIWLVLSTRGLVQATKEGMQAQIVLVERMNRTRLLLKYEDRFDRLLPVRSRVASDVLQKVENAALDPYELLSFLSSLGTMLQTGNLDAGMVWNFFDNPARHYYRALRQFIDYDRKQRNDSYVWGDIDYLVEQLTQVEMRETHKTAEALDAILDTTLESFLKQEARRGDLTSRLQSNLMPR